MPSFCLSKWEKGNETDKESRDTARGGRGEKEEKEEEEEEGKKTGASHFTGKQCHLLILVRVDAGKPSEAAETSSFLPFSLQAHFCGGYFVGGGVSEAEKSHWPASVAETQQRGRMEMSQQRVFLKKIF